MIKTSDTAAGDIVEISLPTGGPYGIVFAADTDGCAAVVQSFERLSNGTFGPIQRHGGVHYGDVLFELNDRCFFNTPLGEVLRVLNDKNISKKNAKFLNAKEYYRRKSSGRILSSQDGKLGFLSTVKQTRYTEKDGKKFAEYEICCLLRVASARLTMNLQDQGDGNVRQWSVWRRYSEFEQLHAAMKSSLGNWQMDSVGSLPSAHRFVMTNKLSPAFVEQRRDDLKEYWQKLLSIDKVADFTKHHCSKALKEFLNVDEQLIPQDGDSSDQNYNSHSQKERITSANMRRKPSFAWSVLAAPSSSSRSPSMSIQSSSARHAGSSGSSSDQQDGSGATNQQVPSRPPPPPPLPSFAPPVPVTPPPLPPSQPHINNFAYEYADERQQTQLPSHPSPPVPSFPPPLPPPPPPPVP